jgi:hypothetical protein
MSSRRLRWLPPALLIAVAFNQMRLVHTADLTPWCGGGFGMFSTTNSRSARHLHAYALSPGRVVELGVPAELEQRAAAALALPAESRLRALASDLAPYAESEFEPPESMRIDVFVMRWHPATLAPVGSLLRSVEVPVARP